MNVANVAQPIAKVSTERPGRMSLDQLRAAYATEITRCRIALEAPGIADATRVAFTRQMKAAQRLYLAITPAKQQELAL